MNHCVYCIHFHRKDSGQPALCLHPSIKLGVAAHERRSWGRCGSDGKLFEEKKKEVSSQVEGGENGQGF